MENFFVEHQETITTIMLLIMSIMAFVMVTIGIIVPFSTERIKNHRKKSLSDDFLSKKYDTIDDDILYRYLKRTYHLKSHEDYIELLEETEKEIIDKQKGEIGKDAKDIIDKIERIIKSESEVKPFDGLDDEIKAFFEGVSDLSADSQNTHTIKTNLHELAKIYRKQEKGLRKNRVINWLALAFSIFGVFATVAFYFLGKSTISEASIEAIRMDHSSEIEHLIEWISETYPIPEE